MNNKIIYKSNGARAVFHIFDLQSIMRSPTHLEQLKREVERFYKYFWSYEGEEDWVSTCDNPEQYYFDFFDENSLFEPIDKNGTEYYFDDLETGKWLKKEVIVK